VAWFKCGCLYGENVNVEFGGLRVFIGGWGLKLKFEGNGVGGGKRLSADGDGELLTRFGRTEEQMDARLRPAGMTEGESRQRDFAETWVIHLGTDPSPELRMTTGSKLHPGSTCSFHS
jgi:hypothetical protein